jgi:hypothetical protein
VSRPLLTTVLLLLALTMGARDQCIPGPFTYDDGGLTDDVPFNGGGNGFDTCFDPSCPDFACTNDAECQGFFGPDSECTNQRCTSSLSCALGNNGGFQCPPNETCAYDGTRDDPSVEGTCRPTSPAPLGEGEACGLDVSDVNPCGGGGFCLPTSTDGGICVVACAGPDECSDGFKCNPPYFGGFAAANVCMPACNLDAPSCGDARLVCVSAAFEPSCTPDSGACVVVGCDGGVCGDLCPNGAGDCGAATFCAELSLTSCRIDAPPQSVSVCSPPSSQGGLCALNEPDSCEAGFACAPAFGSAVCVQQSSDPADDGAACDPNDQQVNRCSPGSYCARAPFSDAPFGVCQRFCNSQDDCDVDEECVRGNVAVAAESPQALVDVRVCAAPCDVVGETCGDGFVCDVDGSACTAGGHCLPAEDTRFCVIDSDCGFDGELVCGGDFHCALPDDACSEVVCDLGDAASCPVGFSCSPFLADTPVCLAQRDVVADGEGCSPFGNTTQCGAGSVCTGGVCTRACNGIGDCSGGQECVRGNLFDQRFDDEAAFGFSSVSVCATPCVAFDGCGGAFQCDVDNGGSCSTGPGHCLGFEGGVGSCGSDADCSEYPGTVCDTQRGQCGLPADLCTP